MSSTQISEWEAFDRIYPIGEDRADFRLSYLCSLITNLVIQIHGKRGAKLTEVSDFDIKWGGGVSNKESEQQKIEAMKHFFLSWAASQNRRAKKEEERNQKLQKNKKQ